MKKKSKKNKFFLGLLGFLFLTYMIIYISESGGYYEFKNYKKTTLTEKQMKKFESDIKQGKKVDLTSYNIKSNENYSNKLSNAGSDLSSAISNMISKGINSFFGTISELANE